jgi:hypothetical protein
MNNPENKLLAIYNNFLIKNILFFKPALFYQSFIHFFLNP